MDKIEVTLKINQFNDRRYTFWIAVVEDFDGISPKLAFEKYDRESVEDKILISFFAKGGDVIYYGWKDHRRNFNEKCWGTVSQDGRIEHIDKREARKIIETRKKEQVA